MGSKVLEKTNRLIINIAQDFSELTGPRFRKNGNYSGEEFYEDILCPKFKALKDGEKLTINFDGTYGYLPSFLEQSFGELARDFGKEKVMDKLVFVSEEEPGLIEEIMSYINQT